MSIHSRIHELGGLVSAAAAVWILSGCTSAAPAAAPASAVTFAPNSAHSPQAATASDAPVASLNPIQQARVRKKPTEEAFFALLTALPANPATLNSQPLGGKRPLGGAPLTVAQGRVLVGGQSSAELGAKLRWLASAKGGLSTEIGISAPGARALRVGLLIEALPDAATLRIFSPTEDTEHVWTGAQVKATLQSLSQPLVGVLGQFWTPQTSGERVVVAIDLPVGMLSSDVRLSATYVSSF